MTSWNLAHQTKISVAKQSSKMVIFYHLQSIKQHVVVVGAEATDPLINAQHALKYWCARTVLSGQRGWVYRVIVETDAATVANAIRGTCFDRSPLGTMIREIRAKFFLIFLCTMSYWPQACNSVAHLLAAIGLNYKNGPVLILWTHHLPDYVVVLLSNNRFGQSVP